MNMTFFIPSKVMMKVGELTKNASLKKKANILNKTGQRACSVEKTFRFFYTGDWCFESKYILQA